MDGKSSMDVTMRDEEVYNVNLLVPHNQRVKRCGLGRIGNYIIIYVKYHHQNTCNRKKNTKIYVTHITIPKCPNSYLNQSK